MTELMRERREELMRRSIDHSEGVTAAERNAARRELHEIDLADMARLDERAADVRRDAVGVLDSLSDPEATWQMHVERLAAGVQWLGNYVLELHELLRQSLVEDPYLEPEPVASEADVR